MHKESFHIAFESYASETELRSEDRALLDLARQSLRDAWAPYSQFKVGAAVLTQSGEMFGGSNQENAAYPMCLCAERVALATAASQAPASPVVAIAVTVQNLRNPATRPAAPCGACRQVICETEYRHNHDIRVIMQGESGPVYVFHSAKDLLPFSFDASFLD
ncbi:MAG: cytidine deaminase [Bacteroidetes bacterium]|nr:MAG: cytidine deaminase [Bacteroidota bacterium]